MTHDELENLIYERTRYFVDVPVADCIFDLIAAEREKVAAWMRSKSYATGHGDTIEDLLKELEWQVAERERERVAEESAELLQALQNLHQRCHWADAPEEMDAAKAAIEKAIRARGNRE